MLKFSAILTHFHFAIHSCLSYKVNPNMNEQNMIRLQKRKTSHSHSKKTRTTYRKRIKTWLLCVEIKYLLVKGTALSFRETVWKVTEILQDIKITGETILYCTFPSANHILPDKCLDHSFPHPSAELLKNWFSTGLWSKFDFRRKNFPPKFLLIDSLNSMLECYDSFG